MLVIKIVNDQTGTEERSNYRYQVMINNQVIDSGSVKEHDRKNGWVRLLELLIKQKGGEK